MYFITCFEKIEIDNRGWLDVGASRTFGFFNNKGKAFDSLHHNSCDMCEHLYEYAVVEAMEEGIHPVVVDRQFFKYDQERGGFFEISEPEEFKHYCNIALG